MITPDEAYVRSAQIFRSTMSVERALQAALAGTDAHVQAFRASFNRMYIRPGQPATASFVGTFLRNGRQEETYLVAINEDIRPLAAHAGFPYGYTEVDGLSISTWRFPMDPILTALPDASTPAHVGRWLTWAGLLADDEQFSINVEQYTPCERAIIRVAISSPNEHDHYYEQEKGIVESHLLPVYIEHPERTLSITIVPPEQADHVRASFAAVQPLGQNFLATPAPGAFIFNDLNGLSFMQQLERYRHTRSSVSTLPALTHLLDQISNHVSTLQISPTFTDCLNDYCTEIVRQNPRMQGVLQHLSAEIFSCAFSGRTPPDIATYGDFSPENIIFNASGAPSALRASSRSGKGHREDDLATLFAHMSVLPLMSPTKYHSIQNLTKKWIEQSTHMHEPARLYARIASGILALSSQAPRDILPQYLGMAEEFTRRAHAALIREPSGEKNIGD